jgi:phytoene synthase
MNAASSTGRRGTLIEFSVNTVEQAREMTRRYAKTFYFASHALPPEKRQAAYALYSFCRYVDNIADEATDSEGARVLLHDVRRRLDEVYDAGHRVARWTVLQETVERYGIPKEYFLDLIEGVEMDLAGTRCRTFAELRKYCYHVASVVGLMMARILQPDDGDALSCAEDLGTAMQLTNILRDVGEDYGMQRIYLPGDEMEEWGLAEDVLAGQKVTPAFRAFMQFNIARARAFYRRAESGIRALPDDGSRFCVRLMSTLYGRILNSIEANGYDVFNRRAHVPVSEKLRLAAAITLRHQGSPYFLLDPVRREAVRSDALRRTQRLPQSTLSK